MAETKEPSHPIDRHVGARMRLRRIELQLSQTALANKLGITFQAVQKYEAGAVRVAASRLYDVGQVLRVTPGYFFEGFADKTTDDLAALGADQRDVAVLLRGYHGIRDVRLRADVRRLVARLGGGEQE